MGCGAVQILKIKIVLLSPLLPEHCLNELSIENVATRMSVCLMTSSYTHYFAMAPCIPKKVLTRLGVVASDAELKMCSKCHTLSQTHCFVPVAVETLGVLGENANAFFADLGGYSASVTKE